MTKATGPFWVNETAEGEHQVCGAHGKVLFRYEGAHAAAMATDHVRRLMKVDKAANARLIAEAPAMLEAIKQLLDYDNLGAYERSNARTAARAIIARIERAGA